MVKLILYQIFNFISTIWLKKWNNLSIQIYANPIENRYAFKLKTGFYLKLLTPEAMKLLGRTKKKITKDKNSEKHLEIIEVVLVHCNILTNDYQHHSTTLDACVLNK